MFRNDRRQFLAEVGGGMLAASLGATLSGDLGLSTAAAAEEDRRLNFGDLEPLVAIMQNTPLEKLNSVLLNRIESGEKLSTLVSAGLLANARTFGGHDYVGFHTFMALTPALEMATELPAARKALPVLKVLYRNTDRIQQFGGSDREVLLRLDAKKHSGDHAPGKAIQLATRKANFAAAEDVMAAIQDRSAKNIFNHVQRSVQDEADVHRVVLAWRAWMAIDLIGEQHAGTLLRQSVRYCLKASENRIDRGRPEPELWTLIPKLFDQYGLSGKKIGERKGDDTWLNELATVFFQSERAQAADAAAQAIADGYAPDQIAEAYSLAANMLLLYDNGREKAADGDKVKGSVHGASVGVHASDAANAWRNIARVSNPRNTIASILVGAYHTAGQSNRVRRNPWPLKTDVVQSVDNPTKLLSILDEAVRGRDQALAAAAVQKYGQLEASPKKVFSTLLRFATSEDGALHAEKYYRTVGDEFARARASTRWGHLVGLARVSASEYGSPAPGYREACELIGVPA